MTPQDLIRKKRDRERLSRQDIQFFVKGVVTGELADYQTSALLMAIFLNGMSEGEQHELTDAMVHSGEILDLGSIAKPKVDKHSTGGVGDKTSLILAPLAAAAGICVPMISGRALGHTGGTLDKLESIPGFKVDLSTGRFREVVEQVGCAMAGQTSRIAPADRKLYALRDSTATVESMPLIVASILSKKLAAGLDALVLDVKTGSGSFMVDESSARELALALVKAGKGFGLRTQALVTSMDQPLGRAVGNALEVKECIDILSGKLERGSAPVLELSLQLAARMVALGRPEMMLEAACSEVQRLLDNGEALERFRACVEAQGGNPSVCDNPSKVLNLNIPEVRVESPSAGYIRRINAAEIGRTIAGIGGGRIRIDDTIDPGVGFIAEAALGDFVEEGALLGRLFCRAHSRAQTVAAHLQAAYDIGEEPYSPPSELIREVISN